MWNSKKDKSGVKVERKIRMRYKTEPGIRLSCSSSWLWFYDTGVWWIDGRENIGLYIEILWGNFMQTSYLPYQGWQSRVGEVCWTVNIKYTLNVTRVLVGKKVENCCPFNPHADLYRHKCGFRFSRSRIKFGLLLNSEEWLKRHSFLETRSYLNKVIYLHIRTDMIKLMFRIYLAILYESMNLVLVF